LKIIIVSAQYIGSISGGGGIHVVELTRELGKLGHNVTVLSMCLGKYKKKETIILKDPYNPDKNRRRAKIKVIRFSVKDSKDIKSPFEGTKMQEINRLMEFRRKVVNYLIQHNGNEVLHIHGHFVIPGMAKDLKQAGTKYKIINSIHTVESISEIKKGKDGADKKCIRIMQEMEQDAIIYSDCVILRSKKVKQQVIKFFPEAVKKAKKIAIRSSGVSSLFIHQPVLKNSQLKAIRKKYNISGDLVLNINRIDPSKGIENLIEAYAKLYQFQRKKCKNQKLSLVIAGMIEEKNKWYYSRLLKAIKSIKEKEIRTSISIHHNIPELDKIGLFNMARVFVLPSLLEPFGITIVEALAKNIPVVASGVEGPMDIMNVKKMRSPFITAPGGVLADYNKPSKRADHLFQSLKYVFSYPHKIEKLVLQGRKKTLKKYAWESLVQQKIKIYQNV